MAKLYQIITLFIFTVLISVPLVKHLTEGDQVKSNENRTLIQRPAPPKSLATITDYTQKMDAYFSDQFGFRILFIKAANILRYYLFNEVTARNISFGKKGFVFLNSHSPKKPHLLFKIVCEAIHISKKKKQETLVTYRRLMEFYRAQGIKANVAIIPLKSKVYPEYLPEPMSTWCLSRTPTWVDQNISKALKGELYYPLDKFMQWKQEFEIFLPSFFHWHGKLPYLVAEDILKTLWEISPDLTAKPVESLIESDLEKNLEGLHFYAKTQNYDYTDLKFCHQQRCIKGLRQLYKNSTSLKFTRKNPSTHRKLLILSDSFGIAIAQNFIRGFDEVVLIETNHLSQQEKFKFYQNIHKTINPTHVLHLYYSGRVFSQATHLKKFLDKR